MAIIKRYPPLNNKQVTTDVQRERDEKGRFQTQEFSKKKEELRSRSGRSKKLVKVNGSYGTYKLEEKKLTDLEKLLIVGAGILILITL